MRQRELSSNLALMLQYSNMLPHFPVRLQEMRTCSKLAVRADLLEQTRKID
jgi:hypothetical protein